MPKYAKDISYIVTQDDVRAMLGRAASARNRALYVFLYLTGPRPIEARQVTKENVTEKPDGSLVVEVQTAKLGRVKGFVVRRRLLPLPADSPFLQIFKDYWATCSEGSLIFDLQPDTIKKLVYHDSEGRLCPYHFRHSRMWKLSQGGASLADLQNWKGAADIRSVSQYLGAKQVTTQRLE